MTTSTEVTETAPVVPAEPDVNDFDAMFAEAVQSLDDEANGTETKPVEADPVVADPVVADPVVADPVVADPVVADPVVADPVADPELDVATRAADAALAKAEAARQKHADDAAATAAAESKEAAEEAARQIEDPVLTDEQQKHITEWEKEWPEQAGAVNTMVGHKLAALEAKYARALVEVVQKVYADMAPLAKSAATANAGSFRQTVLAAHSDYDQIDKHLEGWIKEQPGYLQTAMQRVYNEGSADEFTQLVGDYKKSKGIEAKAPNAPAPAVPAPKPTGKSEAARAKAAALAPVSSQRTTPAPQGSDPNNFDDAFDEAASQY